MEKVSVEPDSCAETLIPVFYNVLQKGKEDRILELAIDSIGLTVASKVFASYEIGCCQFLNLHIL